jgi:hypothetical protein
MKRLMLSIMCSTLLFGAIGVTTQAHAEVTLSLNIPFGYRLRAWLWHPLSLLNRE